MSRASVRAPKGHYSSRSQPSIKEWVGNSETTCPPAEHIRSGRLRHMHRRGVFERCQLLRAAPKGHYSSESPKQHFGVWRVTGRGRRACASIGWMMDPVIRKNKKMGWDGMSVKVGESSVGLSVGSSGVGRRRKRTKDFCLTRQDALVLTRRDRAGRDCLRHFYCYIRVWPRSKKDRYLQDIDMTKEPLTDSGDGFSTTSHGQNMGRVLTSATYGCEYQRPIKRRVFVFMY